MIPKVIHFCWLSDDSYPKTIQKCINSWNKHLNGYEIKLWNFDRFPRGKSAWVDQAFDSRKYAFAADYIRAYALYNEGGIYLDSDVEVLKNFDKFLHLPYFFGQESDSGKIEAAVMGAEKGNPLFKALLEHYDSSSFIKDDGSFDTTPLPSLLSEISRKTNEWTIIDNVDKFQDRPGVLNIFTPDFFSPIHIINMRLEKTSNTVSIHHFAGSWNSPYRRFKKWLQKLIGPRSTLFVQKVKHLIVK